jgi:hypothetical protein
MAKLRPFLQSPDSYTASQQRYISDSFTDQLVAKGKGVLTRPPAKWKVIVMTTMTLFFVAWPVGENMPGRFKRWGLEDKYAQLLIGHEHIFQHLLLPALPQPTGGALAASPSC